MATISIDFNSEQDEIYLIGDLASLKNHRYAWSYFKDYLNLQEGQDKFIISVEGKEPIAMLTAVREALEKYGFEESQTDSSEQVLLDFYEEERKFDEFSQKALSIKNNECNKEEFKAFSESVADNLVGRELYQLQLLAAYHLAFSQNACNFSAPGAGKTSIVYGAYAYLHNLQPSDLKYVERILVVGPLSSFGPWEQEYQECFGRKPSVQRLIGGISREEKQNYLYSKNLAELTLISYNSVDLLKEDLAYFLRYHKVMVVLDEAHKIKNPSGGVWASAVLSLSQYCQARVILTGTPAPNGYEDLYNMFKFIWPTKNVLQFDVRKLRDITERPDEARVQQLVDHISPYFIRIKKSDLNIPPAIIHPPLVVPMDNYQQRIYDFIEQKYVDAIIGDEEIDISSRFKNLLMQARMIRLMQAATDPSMLRKPIKEFMEFEECPKEAYQAIDDANILSSILNYEALEIPSKYKAVKELVEKIISAGEKVVVWATFIHTILGLKDYLNKSGIASQELYGAIPVEHEKQGNDSEEEILTREKIVNDFQKPDCPYKVLIANPYAVAESISLHKACHNAIYIERSFNAAHFMQSKDRIHRYGLTEGTETNYYFIISKDSIDETIDARLTEKEARMVEIMESMPIPLFNNVVEGMGDEDIKALIRDYVKRTKKPR